MERWRLDARIQWIAVGCALLPFVLSGCTRTSEPDSAMLKQARKYAALPGLRGASHPQLLPALQQIESQQQTPAQLDAASPGESYAPFVLAYPALSRPAIQREVNSLWPTTSLRLEPGALQKARELLSQQAAARQRFARALREMGARPRLRIIDSLVADDEWLDAITTGCRIEGLAAAEALAEQQPEAASAPLERMLQASQQLTREGNLNARLAAAAIRADSTQVLHAIANHPAASVATLQHLLQLLGTHTADWPSDERVWIAERAHGLLTYEVVRSGYYSSLLPHHQQVVLERKGLVHSTAAAAVRDVDQDELFYLRAMQQQIAAAKLPYFQRKTVIEQLQAELQTRSESGEYPLVAGSLLLNKIAEIHRTQAEDRARCEAWLIALTAACERPLGDLPICCLTGSAYELQADRERVRIQGLNLRAGEVVEVIRPGVIQARRRAAGFDLSPRPLRLE